MIIGRTKRITAAEAKTANPPASKNAPENDPLLSAIKPVKAGPIIPSRVCKKMHKAAD